jgi:protein TonB
MKSKNPKANLEKSKALFFEIGLVAALALSLAAFEWKSKGDIDFPIVTQGDPTHPDFFIPEPIIDKKPPEPPKLPSMDKIIIVPDSDVDLIDNPDIFIELTNEQLKFIPLYRDPSEDKEVDEVIDYVAIQDKPTFMGKDYNEFSRYIGRNLKYPEKLAEIGIQGMVLISFIVDVDGSVTNVRVVRGVDPLLDQEAVRVVSSSPKWEPGRQRTKPTKVSFNFPIYFRLQ